jgi:beta-galactosidase
MKPIQYTRQSYIIDGQPVYLLSGEFHYFRVPKADWRRRMQLFKEAGGNCLATYIPWLIHEPSEGVFRFTGEDWLDVEGFFQAAQAEGLYVIARPGPYQYSELVYDGLPGWLVKNYPQILARNIQGKPFRESSVSYLHPVFLDKVRRWFDRVCPLIAPYTVSNGGPVAFVQLDNEMVGIHEWFGTLDYNTETMGFRQPGGRYSRFLEGRYQRITWLNEAYAYAYTKFEEVQPGDKTDDPLVALRRRKDYYDFYASTIAEYSSTLTKMIRDNHINVPVVHNSGNPGMNAHFIETARELGAQYLLGSDHYYNLDQNWQQNHPTPQYAARMFVSLEMLRLMGFPPTVFELPGGSASNWPPITPSDALACYLSNLAFGMKGSNYYIFTGGPNPPGAGKTTDLYDYGAGIGARGDIRPLYQAQKSFGEVIRERPWLVSAERISDLRIGMDFEYPRSAYFDTVPMEGFYSSNEAWNFLRRGPLTTALCAGLSPSFVDLDQEDWFEDLITPLVVVSSSSMAASRQQRIVEFIKKGGKALITPVLPSMDETFHPCSVLADFLGSAPEPAIPAEQTRAEIAGVSTINGYVYFSNPPEGASIVGKDEWSGKPIAWSKAFDGGGTVVFVGLAWTHQMDEHTRMFVALLKAIGLEPFLTCSNPNVWCTLWRHEEHGALFLLNLFTSPMDVEVSFNIGRGSYHLEFPQVPAMTVMVKDIGI